MVSWNTWSLSENDQLPLFSNDLRGLTCYQSGMSKVSLSEGISTELQPFVVEVTPVDEPILQVKLKHTLHVSCCSVCPHQDV